MLLAPIMDGERLFKPYLDEMERQRMDGNGMRQQAIHSFLTVAPTEKKRELPPPKAEKKKMRQSTLL